MTCDIANPNAALRSLFSASDLLRSFVNSSVVIRINVLSKSRSEELAMTCLFGRFLLKFGREKACCSTIRIVSLRMSSSARYCRNPPLCLSTTPFSFHTRMIPGSGSLHVSRIPTLQFPRHLSLRKASMQKMPRVGPKEN